VKDGLKPQVVVVTGGNGFIGSHMCRRLFLQGFKVIALDDFSTSPSKPVHDFAEFMVGDSADKGIWETLFERYQVQAVFHFAARAIVSESEKRDHTFIYYEENVVKTLRLLELLTQEHRHVGAFIFSSSCATFGDHRVAIQEESDQKPINTYGASKLIVELVLKDLARKKMLKSVVLRYFNACGSTPDLSLGENHLCETHLIPNLILARHKETPFELYGDSFDTKDGTCVRDYVHVEDLVDAHSAAWKYIAASSLYFDDFNLGSGEGFSILEVLKTTEEVMGQQIPIVKKTPRAGDPASLVACTVKAKKHLNFSPKYKLIEAIEHTYQYIVQKRKKWIDT
jgi:UDP-glucose 4-epimerase